MASQSVQPNMVVPQSDFSCYKKKKTGAEGGFWTNVKNTFGEFLNTPMDWHTICLKKTMCGVTNKFKKPGTMLAPSKTDKEKDAGAAIGAAASGAK